MDWFKDFLPTALIIVCAFAVATLICAATYETPHAATIADWQYPW
jgi:hypothetical protein